MMVRLVPGGIATFRTRTRATHGNDENSQVPLYAMPKPNRIPFVDHAYSFHALGDKNDAAGLFKPHNERKGGTRARLGLV